MHAMRLGTPVVQLFFLRFGVSLLNKVEPKEKGTLLIGNYEIKSTWTVNKHR